VELAKKEPRKIFIDVYTDWCGWCKIMDANTFNHKVIADYLNTKFYPVKFNAEQKEDIVLGNMTFKYVPNGKRGYHELAAALLNGQMSYPSVVFLTENVEMITPVPGYIKPKEFDPILKYIGEDYYKTEKFEEWKLTYKSPIVE
jgi:thioredoxin-related protein